MRPRLSICLVLLSLCALAVRGGEPNPPPTKPLSDLSIEDLLNVKITSVSKKEETASTAPAAIHVITQDDMRRAGVNSIAEALRLAPGMNVGKIDARQWAISARGGQDQFANKLLVLIDGRSVYTPAFSGVFWDVQDTVLEDIDRIEVIRGPGATLWGANAVNGVINIITKSSKETQGGLVVAGVGTEEHGNGAVRYGFKVGEKAYMRVYGKFDNHADSVLTGGENSNDAWRQARGGMRFDWNPTKDNKVTIQGDGYHIASKQSYTIPTLTPTFEQLVNSKDDFAGGNVLGRWTHTVSDKSDFSLQVYYDRTRRSAPVFDEVRDTFDLDFQWRMPAGDRHELVWGVGYRALMDENDSRPVVNFVPDSRRTHLVSGFVQDDITLIREKLHFIFGSKFEYNSYTGFEVQPSARMLWTPKNNHTVWASISRALRTPSRSEDSVALNGPVLPPGTLGPGTPVSQVRIFGDKDYKSEELMALELGYRSKPLHNFSFDIALFYNRYEDLRTGENRTPFLEAAPVPHLVIPQIIENNMHGHALGGEIVANYQPLKWWRLSAQYSYLKVEYDLQSNSTDYDALHTEKDAPEHQLSLRTNFDLPQNVEVGAGMRYISRIQNRDVPGYIVGDATIIWSPLKRLSLSLTGQNLFDNRHPEFAPSYIRTPRSEVEHSVFFKLTYKF